MSVDFYSNPSVALTEALMDASSYASGMIKHLGECADEYPNPQAAKALIPDYQRKLGEQRRLITALCRMQSLGDSVALDSRITDITKQRTKNERLLTLAA